MLITTLQHDSALGSGLFRVVRPPALGIVGTIGECCSNRCIFAIEGFVVHTAIRGFLCVVLGALCFGSPAFAAKRVALVIGNDAYESLPVLKKAVNDARAVAGTLEEIGFTVVRGENLTRREMNRKLADLESKIAPGDQVFFFFAGHGVALGGDNFLIPSDMPRPQLGEESLVRGEAFAVNTLVARTQARGAGASFFVLDACRDNPFAATGVRSIGGTRGLTRVDAPSGVFVLFSAGIGQTALDRLGDSDPDPNSVFTRRLVPLLKTPGLNHVRLAKRLQQEVSTLASTISHPQQPAYYDQILGEIVLRPGDPAGSATITPKSPLGPAAQVWQVIKDTKTAGDLEAFIARFPDSFFAGLAKSRLKTMKRQDVAVGTFPEDGRPADGTAAAPGREFQDCSDCPTMVEMPAGSFMMGSPKSEVGRDGDEGPQRKVTISKPFAVGKFEVTFAEWDACVAANGCGHKPDDLGWGHGRRPVINVSWDDAKEYVSWLSSKTGKTYRLLTEAEWEYVVRAGTTTPFSTGRTITTDQANFDGNYSYAGSPKGINRDQSVPVGTLPANRLGLHETHGNVAEWVEDCWSKTYSGVPTDGSASTAGDCSRRVLRGGSFYAKPRDLRSADRFRYRTDFRIHFLGFRVAR